MSETAEHLHHLETEISRHGHTAADRTWLREAYFRLLLSQVRSSAAEGGVRRAAAEARAAHAHLEVHHGPASSWAQGRARQWRRDAPESFVSSPALDDGWTWRSALWGVPALAAAFSLVFAVIALFSGPEEGQHTLAWVLIPGLLALPVVGAGVVYRHVLARHGNLRAVLVSGLGVFASIPLIAWLVVDALDVALPAGAPWPWIALAGYVLLAAACWALSRRVPGSGADDGLPGPVRVLGASEVTTDQTWFVRFRAALHARGGVTDQQVRRIVKECEERVRAAGTRAVEAFGSPWEYAQELPHDPRVGPRRATAGYGVLALLWFAMVGSDVVSGEGDQAWTRLVLGAVMLGVCLVSAARWYRAAHDVTEGGATGA